MNIKLCDALYILTVNINMSFAFIFSITELLHETFTLFYVLLIHIALRKDYTAPIIVFKSTA